MTEPVLRVTAGNCFLALRSEEGLVWLWGIAGGTQPVSGGTVCPSVMSIAKRGCVLCLGVRVAQGEHLTPDTGAGPCHLPLSEAGT